MKEALKIDGFVVDIFPSVRRGSTSWTAWRQEHPAVRAEAVGCEEAITALQSKWDEIKAAYREASLPVPTPARRRGNKRVHDKIRMLGERKGSNFLAIFGVDVAPRAAGPQTNVLQIYCARCQFGYKKVTRRCQ